MGRKSGLLYFVNGLVFTLSFLAVRGVLMTIMFVRVWSRDDVPHPFLWPGCTACSVVMVCAWAFMALQYIWCVKVVHGSLSFLKKGDKAGKGKKAGEKAQ